MTTDGGFDFIVSHLGQEVSSLTKYLIAVFTSHRSNCLGIGKLKDSVLTGQREANRLFYLEPMLGFQALTSRFVSMQTGWRLSPFVSMTVTST